MAFKGKTDWNYNDIVTERDMNRIEQGIQEVSDEVAKKEAESLTLAPGVQTVTVDRDTPLNVTSIKGRTLVNLLGRDGNFEISNQWSSVSFAILETVNTDSVYGNSSLKLTVGDNQSSGAAGSGNIINRLRPEAYYIALAEFKSGNGAQMQFQAYSESGGINGNLVEEDSFKPSVLKFQLTSTSLEFRCISRGNAGQYGYVDGARLYEITEEEYNAIDSMTPEQVAAAYPYVDSLQNVNGVFIQNNGGNLVPTDINSWAQGTLSTSTGAEADNTLRLRSAFVDVLPNTQYTVSVAIGDVGVFQYSDTDFLSSVALTPSQVTFTTTATTTRVRFILRIDNTTILMQNDLSRFSPMLVIGQETKPYQTQRQSYLYLPSCQLGSYADGTVADSMYVDDEGNPRVVRQFRLMELSGDLDWFNNTAGSNYKEVRSLLTDSKPNTGYVIKYDGKIINSVNPLNGPDQFNHNNGFFRVTIHNSDSGWGPDYRPTNDEIKAYFNGWKMWASGQDSKTGQYNGTGTKYWGYWDRNGNIVNGTSVLPTTSAYENSNAAYKPYQLQYQLAEPMDEPLEHEGSLMLYEGDNQIKVGTGNLVREKGNPRSVIHEGIKKWYINNTLVGSALSKRVEKIKTVYQNGEVFTNFIARQISGSLYIYGKQDIEILDQNFDPSAVYQVTYLALDTYKIGIAPSSISAEYAPNLRGTVDDLVQGNKDALSRISVVESQMAMKEQPQCIIPTLLNGWENYNTQTHEDVQYYKDKLGIVHIVGIVKGTVVTKNSLIFILPHGYRPNKKLAFSQSTKSLGEDMAVSVTVDVSEEGRVLLGTPARDNWLTLTGISFRAKQ